MKKERKSKNPFPKEIEDKIRKMKLLDIENKNSEKKKLEKQRNKKPQDSKPSIDIEAEHYHNIETWKYKKEHYGIPNCLKDLYEKTKKYIE